MLASCPFGKPPSRLQASISDAEIFSCRAQTLPTLASPPTIYSKPPCHHTTSASHSVGSQMVQRRYLSASSVVPQPAGLAPNLASSRVRDGGLSYSSYERRAIAVSRPVINKTRGRSRSRHGHVMN